MKDPDPSGTNREREIFLEALEMQEEAARAAFLHGACGQDPALRLRVESLFQEHYSSSTLLDNPAVPPLLEMDASKGITEGPGTQIGRYKLLQKLGEGGFGVVYMAEQREPVKRRVALKIIKLGMDTRQVIARFEAERQALALMDHPNIAKVLDGGATETGRPFFVMELVKGVPITKYCNDNALATRDRLKLFILVCQAIQHAHQKGIIHRDIKPSNVMVTLHDGVPVPKVIDFGIAKATQQELTEKTIFTQYQHMLGTPAYMSPEQAELSGLDIDTRSDIYSLGVLLYELLVGRTPLNARSNAASGPEEIRRRIRDQEPQRPSTCISTLNPEEKQTLYKHRRMEADKIREELRGDLDWIVLKALEKDRRRRYDTAVGLARDIQCYLNHEPVTAAPPSRTYLAGKYMRRHATALTVGASFLGLLVAGTILSSWQAARATRAQFHAEQAGERERLQRLFAQEQQKEAEDQRKRADQAAEMAREAEESAQQTAYSAQMLLAQASWNDANFTQLQNLLAKTATYPERSFEWYFWHHQCRLDRATLLGHKETIQRLAISPDGGNLASADSLGIIKLWNLRTHRERFSIPAHPAEIRGLTFSPDGNVLASGDTNSWVRLWNPSTGLEIESFSAEVGPIRALRFSADGRQLAICARNGGVHLRTLTNRLSTTHLPPTTASAPAISTISQDFKWVACGYKDGTLKLWDTATRTLQPISEWIHPQTIGWHWIHSIDFSPDGRWLAATAADGEFRVINTEDGTVRFRLAKVTNRPELFAAFSPDGTQIALAGGQVVRLLDSQSGEEIQQFRGHTAQIQHLAFSGDGQTLVSADQHGVIKVWDLEPTERPARFSGHTRVVNSLQFSPDGQSVIASDWRDRTLVWDANSGLLLKELRLSAPSQLLPDNRRFLASHGIHIGSNSLFMVDIHSGRDLPGFPAVNVLAFATTTNGQTALTFSADGVARLWNTTSGDPLSSHPVTLNGFRALALSPRGDLAAIANSEGVHLLAIDPGEGNPISRLRTLEATAHSLAYSPDGARLLMGTEGIVKVCDSRTGRELLQLDGHTRFVSSIEYSPDGTRIATASDDGTIRLWQSKFGHELLALKAHRRGVFQVRFSPDGKKLVSASASSDAKITIWQSATPEQVDAWMKQQKELDANLRKRPAIGEQVFLP